MHRHGGKRHKMGKRHSRKVFTRTAKRVHHKNHGLMKMRGGIRL